MTMNENLLGKCNMEVPDPLETTQGVVPEVYANAIRERKAREEQITTDFKEAEDNLAEFEKETQRTQINVKGTPEMKKMHLDESLFEATEHPDKDALRISTDIRDFMENNDDMLYNEEEYFTYEDRRALSKASSALAAFAEMYADDHLNEAVGKSTDPVYKQAEQIADAIQQFIDDNKELVNDREWFTDKVSLEKAQRAFEDFAVKYAHIMDMGNVTEAVVTDEPKKKTRGKNEVKRPEDYSSADLWLQIYDELDASLENEGEGQQVNRFLKSRKGDRYQYIFPHGDNDIVVGATDPSKFEYAKKVADYYGVTYDEPKEDKNPSTNKYYKWTMVIHIPQDAPPVKKH